ncbi:hypothetical protein Ancab_033491 [Ancistrocladus abbreviatus]
MFLSDDRVKGSVSLEDQSMTKFPDGKPSTTTTPSFLIRSAAECDDEAKSADSSNIMTVESFMFQVYEKMNCFEPPCLQASADSSKLAI